MINPDMHLRADALEGKEKAATRDGFGRGEVEAGREDSRIVALSADLEESTRDEWFAKEFPDRFIEVGVAEQNLAALASGMANYGKIPFITSYATFSPGRNWEQIRTTIALNDVPVKIVGMHAGLITGADGGTHQALEDMAIMRALPNMIVISPSDAEEGRKATIAAAKNGKPTYLRFAREKTPVMTTAETPFEIGKANILWKTENKEQAAKNSVAIFSTGPVTYNALMAAKELEESGVSVTLANVHTLKPLDEETIVREAQAAGAVVTVEEHQIHGGLGGAIAELLAKKAPLPIEFIGVQDRFGQTGNPDELFKEYGLDTPSIIEAAKRAILRA